MGEIINLSGPTPKVQVIIFTIYDIITVIKTGIDIQNK
jgi:hypothetical protein